MSVRIVIWWPVFKNKSPWVDRVCAAEPIPADPRRQGYFKLWEAPKHLNGGGGKTVEEAAVTTRFLPMCRQTVLRLCHGNNMATKYILSTRIGVNLYITACAPLRPECQRSAHYVYSASASTCVYQRRHSPLPTATLNTLRLVWNASEVIMQHPTIISIHLSDFCDQDPEVAQASHNSPKLSTFLVWPVVLLLLFMALGGYRTSADYVSSKSVAIADVGPQFQVPGTRCNTMHKNQF
ncbi:hypothetical protein C8J57DRAFT_1229385 [Mycena rebaudengoi]|nr:hypothetical protein C8J57DRAFT_1229385 [Mycena rebaudengoi]